VQVSVSPLSSLLVCFAVYICHLSPACSSYINENVLRVVCSGCVAHRCSSVSSYHFFCECHQLPFFLLVCVSSPLESFMLVACKELLFFVPTLFALIRDSLITWVMVVWLKCNGLLVAVYSLVCCSCGPSEL